MPVTRPQVSTQKTLLRAMHVNDTHKFSQILDEEGWPRESEWSDYELLFNSIKFNHRRIANILLDKGARVTKNDYRSRANTPLHLAATKKTAGWPQVVSRLLSKGASITRKNSKGETALHLAFYVEADVIVDTILREILKRKSVLRQYTLNKDRLSFLHIACARTNLYVVDEILEDDGSLLNLQVLPTSNAIYAGYTPLHFAVENERFDIVDYLLNKGADIYKQSAKGSTPLHLALESRNIDMIDLILSYDEDKNDKINNFGLSHFMAACAGSNESLVAAYLRPPAFPNALMKSQIQTITHPYSRYTPLHFAAEFGRRHTVKLLLSRGADCCMLATNNLTPHLLAHQNHHDNVARLLDKHCNTCKGSTESSRIVRPRYEKFVEQDELGDVVIRFERREGTDSSSDDDSVGSGDDIAKLSHTDLLSYFVNEKNSSNVKNQQCDESFNYDFFDKTASSEVRDENTGRAVNEAGESVAFGINQLTPLHMDFYRAVEGLIDKGAEVSSEEKSVESDAKDSGVASINSGASQNVPSNKPIQFSIPIDNNAASVFDIPQNSDVDMMNSSPINLTQIPSTSLTNAVQVPEIYSIPWSLTSETYCDLPVNSHTTDSELTPSNSLTGSYSSLSSSSQTDKMSIDNSNGNNQTSSCDYSRYSGLSLSSQTDKMSIDNSNGNNQTSSIDYSGYSSLSQTNIISVDDSNENSQNSAMDYSTSSLSSKAIDKSSFLPIASSTPFKRAPVVDNNNLYQFVNINGNVYYYENVSFV